MRIDEVVRAFARIDDLGTASISAWYLLPTTVR